MEMAKKCLRRVIAEKVESLRAKGLQMEAKLIKIYIEKSVQMTEGDMERVKDLEMKSEPFPCPGGQQGVMFFKQDSEGNQYIFKLIVVTKR